MKTFISVLLTLILTVSSTLMPTQVYESTEESLSVVATLNKASGQKSRQGFAIYGNYLLQGYNQGEVNVYDISLLNQTGVSLGKINRVGNFTLGTSGHGMHVNTMSFSDQKLSDAAFPLLYVTGGDSPVTDEGGNIIQSGVRYDFCTVENITKTDEGYTSQTVQTIRLDSSFKNRYFFTWMVDGDYLYTFSAIYRTNGTTRAKDAQNRYVITKFKRPAVAEDGSTSEVTLTQADLVEQKEYPYTVEYTQGSTLFDGTVMTCYGTGTTEFPDKICAYNYDTGKEVLEADLSSLTSEIESCYVANSNLYFITQDGKLYSLKLQESGASRFFGATRYETCLAVSDLYKAKTGTDQYDSVVIACGSNFPDALSGAYLANTVGAPIVLMKETDNDEIMEYLKENVNPDGTVYLLGGTPAISETVETELKSMFPNTKRLSGPTRYETNLAILEETGVTGQDLLVCRGDDFADALSVSSLGKPILLVNNKSGKLTEEQKDFLKENPPANLYVIGSTEAVSDELKTQLEDILAMSATRVSGSTRYDTNHEVLNTFLPGTDNLFLAYGENFPDALCASTVANFLNAPIVLTKESTNVSRSIREQYKNANVYAIGGEYGSDVPQLTDKSVQKVKAGRVIEYEYGVDLQRQ